jgi:hypothetical protein
MRSFNAQHYKSSRTQRLRVTFTSAVVGRNSDAAALQKQGLLVAIFFKKKQLC